MASAIEKELRPDKFNREQAWSLLNEYTLSASLLNHALAVESAMNGYARHYNIDAEEAKWWAITGLLHDFDYEKFPELAPGGHPYVGCQVLQDLGYPPPVTEAIMGHALYSGVARTTLMAKVLFAVDELSGLIVATALVRPDKSLAQVEVRSVEKKIKDKAFARGCNRDDIKLGVEELGTTLSAHIEVVLRSLQSISETLSL